MNRIGIFIMALNMLFIGVSFVLCLYRYSRDRHRVALMLSGVFFFIILLILNKMLFVSGFIPRNVSMFATIVLSFYTGFLVFFSVYILLEDVIRRSYGMIFTIAGKLVPIYAFVTIMSTDSAFWRIMPSGVFQGLSEVISGLILLRYFDREGKQRKIRAAIIIFCIGLIGHGLLTPLFSMAWNSPGLLTALQAVVAVFELLIAAGLMLFFL